MNVFVPSCEAGMPLKLAVSGDAGGPATVAVTAALRLRFPAEMDPDGSVIVTAARPSGSISMFQFWFWSAVARLARLTLPSLTVKASRTVV